MAAKQDKPAVKKTTARAKTTKPRATRRRRSAPTHDAIATRAYELYLGRAEGDDVSHWLQAERELVATS
jgi:hypothetical protein